MATKKASTESNPFGFDPAKMWGSFDPAKMMGEFDPSKIINEMSSTFAQMKMPQFDMAPVLEIQRRNLEALGAANKLAVEGLQTLFKRQAEILTETLNEATTALQDLRNAGTPQDQVAAQAEMIKESFERALVNLRELTEIVAKSNSEAAGAVTKRVSENLDEIKSEVLKLKQ